MNRPAVKRRFTRKKLVVLFVSFVVAANMGLASYFYFTKDMTDWQRNQPVDIQNKRGLTRAKAYADSGIVAGLSFGICAGAILLIEKLKNGKK